MSGDWYAAMRPLVAQYGESSIREHAASVLGYPAEWCHTADEARAIRKSVNQSMNTEN